MDILEFHGPHGWLQILCVVVDKSKSKLAASGVQQLRYAMGGNGFSGCGDSFVEEVRLSTFCKGLIDLADGGNTETRLDGNDVRGLELRLLPGPELGRVSVEGRIVQTSWRTLQEEDGSYMWSSQFGFWVERDKLAFARRVNWVNHYCR